MQAVIIIAFALVFASVVNAHVVEPIMRASGRREERLNLDRMLDVIAEVENSHGRIGPSGEVTPWQLLPSVWYSYTSIHHLRATPKWQRHIARSHAETLLEQLKELMLPATPKNFALLWNAGYGAVQSGKIPAAKLDYAQRAQNLYLSRCGAALY